MPDLDEALARVPGGGLARALDGPAAPLASGRGCVRAPCARASAATAAAVPVSSTAPPAASRTRRDTGRPSAPRRSPSPRIRVSRSVTPPQTQSDTKPVVSSSATARPGDPAGPGPAPRVRRPGRRCPGRPGPGTCAGLPRPADGFGGHREAAAPRSCARSVSAAWTTTPMPVTTASAGPASCPAVRRVCGVGAVLSRHRRCPISDGPRQAARVGPPGGVIRDQPGHSSLVVTGRYRCTIAPAEVITTMQAGTPEIVSGCKASSAVTGS